MNVAPKELRPGEMMSATNPNVKVHSPAGIVMFDTDFIDTIPWAEIPVFPGLKFKYVWVDLEKGLVASLQTHLGDARLNQSTTPVLITTYDLQARAGVLLRSDRDDISMVDAAHASSAAPTYFEPLRLGDRTYVDGGVGAINPSLHAYAETAGKPSLLLSLGTGSQTRPLPYDKVKDWGKLEWAAPILDVVFDATADAVDSQLARLIDGHYIRLQTRLTEASDALDDASADNLAALRREAEKLIADRSADIDRACELLTAA